MAGIVFEDGNNVPLDTLDVRQIRGEVLRKRKASGMKSNFVILSGSSREYQDQAHSCWSASGKWNWSRSAWVRDEYNAIENARAGIKGSKKRGQASLRQG